MTKMRLIIGLKTSSLHNTQPIFQVNHINIW